MNFEDRLAAHAARVGTHLSAALAELPAGPVAEAMAYAAEGGKRLRAFLVIESAALFDIPTERALWPAAAIEAMHAYSLIHDDLPAMDDDDLRRGRPTSHVKYGEAMAMLVGDALATLPYVLIQNETSDQTMAAAIIGELSSATVAMITGSAMLAGIASPETLGFHPVYLATAIGGGSLVGSWMNDSGFWIFAKMGGLTEVEALKSWSILLVVLGTVSLLTTLLLANVMPMA